MFVTVINWKVTCHSEMQSELQQVYLLLDFYMFMLAKANMENKLNSVILSSHNMWCCNLRSCNFGRSRTIQGFQVSRRRMLDQNSGTRSRYLELNALNQKKIASYGSGLWRGCRHFQQRYNQSLHVLLNVCIQEGISNAHLSKGQRHCVSKLKHTRDQFKGRNINHTICLDPEMLSLAQLLERDVLRGSSRVRFIELRGWGTATFISLSSGKVPSPFSVKRYAPFSLKPV